MRASRIRRPTQSMSSSVDGSTARRSATARSSALRPATRSTATTPSSSSSDRDSFKDRAYRHEVRRDRQACAGVGCRVRGLLRRCRLIRRAPSPRTSLGFERIVYTKGTAAGDDPPQSPGPALKPRSTSACCLRDRTRLRGRELGRRHSRRRRHGHGPCVLRRRRPEGLGRRARRQARRVLEVVWRLQGHARPLAPVIGKPTVTRIQGIAVGGGNELPDGPAISP